MTPSTTSAQIRHYLDLTQEELSYYLGVSRARVADAEAGRAAVPRSYTYDAQMRLNYLFFLLPMAEVSTFSKPSVSTADVPPMPPLPLPPPAVPLTATELKEVDWQLRTARTKALVLRLNLDQRTAQAAYHTLVQAHRQALLAAFEAPTSAALSLREVCPDEKPTNTQYLVDLLKRRAADTEWPTPSLTPLALTRDRLRLHLLETEAATLAAWLGE